MEPEITNQPAVKPKAKANWWPFLLGLVAFITGPVLGIIANLTKNESETGGDNATAAAPNLGLLALVFAVAAIVAAIIGLKKDRRSASVWVGLALGVIALGYYAFIAFSELAG